MRHYYSLDGLHLKNTWVTIGFFDGVHRGHQSLIRNLVQGSQMGGCPSVVITFFPHPSSVLRGTPGPIYLTSPEMRANYMAELGVDYVITLNFDKQLASLSPEDFIQLLNKSLHIQSLYVGYDFALGRNRTGDVMTLQKIGLDSGFETQIVAPYFFNGKTISSSQIRSLISEGRVDIAAENLGHWYKVPGTVVHGDGRGRSLNVPTANLYVWDHQLIPANGIYATRVKIGQQYFPSVTNIGRRPTFENQPVAPRIETHILDFSQDIYGEHIQVEFINYLRPEIRYNNIQQLIQQIEQDKKLAREVLSDVTEAPYISS